MEKRHIRDERKEAETFGVAVFIIDNNGRIFTLREDGENVKTGKKAGEYGVVCETARQGETPDSNFWRGLGEELGIPDSIYPKIIDFSDYRIFETGFKDKVWATVVVLHCKNPDLFTNSVGKTGETDGVEPVGFLSRQDFSKLNLRQGVRNILDKFGDDIFEKWKI
jgi:hypothetical protein